MKIALYPGSFNPWHVGHEDVFQKAYALFDKIIVTVGINASKTTAITEAKVAAERRANEIRIRLHYLGSWDKMEVTTFSGLLVDYANEVGASAIVRGLRNGHDLQYEMNQQYWNEDLGLKIPIVYFVTDRKHSHISSSVLRELGLLIRKDK